MDIPSDLFPHGASRNMTRAIKFAVFALPDDKHQRPHSAIHPQLPAYHHTHPLSTKLTSTCQLQF